MAPKNLTRLVNCSKRNLSVGPKIDPLVQTCQRNNGRLNVSGLLRYNGDHFLQVFDRARMFPAWSMGLHQGMDAQTREVYLRYFATDDVNSETFDIEILLDGIQNLSVELVQHARLVASGWPD